MAAMPGCEASVLRVTGPATFPRNVIYSQDYLQQVRLSSTVDRVMRRTLGTTLLSEDLSLIHI